MRKRAFTPRSAKTEPIRVVVADDLPDARYLAKYYLDDGQEPPIELVGAWSTIEELLDALTVTHSHPDVILLDYLMASHVDLQGPTANVKLVREVAPNAALILWTGVMREAIPTEVIVCVEGVLDKNKLHHLGEGVRWAAAHRPGQPEARGYPPLPRAAVVPENT